MTRLPTRIAMLVVAAASTVPAPAQEASRETPTPQAVVSETRVTAHREVYLPADFARFAPSNALEMLNQVPGFSIVSADQGRGLGQASENVLINGERVASKSEDVFDVLRRISANRVARIEIVDGATLGIPGLSGQVADVIASSGEVSGRFEYRATWRRRFASTSYGGGELSLSGSTERLEWSAALGHDTGRGGAGAGEGGVITDDLGVPTEYRDVMIQFVGEFPRIAGRVKWDGPGSLVANFTGNYGRNYNDFSNDEYRDLVAGEDRLRDFDNRGRGYSYEFGGDVDFALGPGRLKLIGLERFNHNTGRSDSLLVFAGGSTTTGNRFRQHSDSGERIGRAEYRWDRLGGQWQLDAEAAFNRLDRTASLFNLNAAGDFVEIDFPSGSGGVTEDRYEVILNHNRTLREGLSLQLGVGGEYSRLAQTGSGGQVRTFRRPKGSATLAWIPLPGLDLSFKIARTVGQLDFGDFLANVNLAQDNRNAGNALLVPQQAWNAELEIRRNLRDWGSATLRLYARWIEDYIDIIPVADGLESSGNVMGGARLYGASLNATINLDPVGWQGARFNGNASIEDSKLRDPLTQVARPFSNHNDWRGEVSLRYDVPGSDWAMGGGFNWTHVQPYVRLFETGRDFEGPIYTFAYVEHKDVFGLTVNLNMFNLTGGEAVFDRTVYSGLRDRSAIEFMESRRLNVSTIYRIQVRGSF